MQQWSTDIRASQKADVYCIIKSDNNLEIGKYITVVKNNCHRITLTRIRCSAHKLMIEEGRYRNIDRNQRVCTKCNMNVIENEFHFVLVCPIYRQLRNECLPRYNIGPKLDEDIQNFANKSDYLIIIEKPIHNFELHHIDENKVSQIINNLLNKSSCGFDGISLKLTKYLKPLYH